MAGIYRQVRDSDGQCRATRPAEAKCAAVYAGTSQPGERETTVYQCHQ